MLLSIKFGQTEMILSGWHWQKIRFNSTHTSAYKKNYFNKLWHGSFGMSPLFFSFLLRFCTQVSVPFLVSFCNGYTSIHCYSFTSECFASLIIVNIFIALSWCHFFLWPAHFNRVFRLTVIKMRLALISFSSQPFQMYMRALLWYVFHSK